MINPIIHGSLLLLLTSACSPTTKKNVDLTAVQTDERDSLEIAKERHQAVAPFEVPTELAQLTPIDVLEGKSANVYEKYGIEFSGNCYACDLASLSIAKSKVIWTNVCDESDAFEVVDFSFTVEAEKAIIKTAERTYVLTKIDPAPVYELLIEGEKLQMDNKRISRYYTTPEALPRFKECDCGDFEG